MHLKYNYKAKSTVITHLYSGDFSLISFSILDNNWDDLFSLAKHLGQTSISKIKFLLSWSPTTWSHGKT